MPGEQLPQTVLRTNVKVRTDGMKDVDMAVSSEHSYSCNKAWYSPLANNGARSEAKCLDSMKCLKCVCRRCRRGLKPCESARAYIYVVEVVLQPTYPNEGHSLVRVQRQRNETYGKDARRKVP